MRVITDTLPASLADRLPPLLAAAERAGCSLVQVSLDINVGFAARIECEGEAWTMDAGDFRYLLAHMQYHVAGLTT